MTHSQRGRAAHAVKQTHTDQLWSLLPFDFLRQGIEINRLTAELYEDQGQPLRGSHFRKEAELMQYVWLWRESFGKHDDQGNHFFDVDNAIEYQNIDRRLVQRVQKWLSSEANRFGLHDVDLDWCLVKEGFAQALEGVDLYGSFVGTDWAVLSMLRIYAPWE